MKSYILFVIEKNGESFSNFSKEEKEMIEKAFQSIDRAIFYHVDFDSKIRASFEMTHPTGDWIDSAQFADLKEQLNESLIRLSQSLNQTFRIAVARTSTICR